VRSSAKAAASRVRHSPAGVRRASAALSGWSEQELLATALGDAQAAHDR
jgi:hypothetical protein